MALLGTETGNQREDRWRFLLKGQKRDFLIRTHSWKKTLYAWVISKLAILHTCIHFVLLKTQRIDMSPRTLKKSGIMNFSEMESSKRGEEIGVCGGE